VKEHLGVMQRRVFGCHECHGTGVVMSRGCDCGGSPYTGHEEFCATMPCPHGCTIAQTRDDALAVWCAVWKQEAEGRRPGLWPIWATFISGFGLGLAFAVLSGQMRVDDRWVAGGVTAACSLLLGFAGVWDQVKSR